MITGKAYTSHEINYDKTGHYTTYKYYGYTGLSYTSTENDYVWSSTTGKYTLVDTEYFNASVLTEKIVYNADATRTATFYGITAKAYTSYEIDYDKTGHYAAYKYYGYTGLSYTSTENDYVWSSTTGKYTLVDTEYFNASALIEKIVYNADATRTVTYYGITAKAYTSYEIDYDKAGHYTTYKYYGYTALSYTSTENDYVWSSTTGNMRLRPQYFKASALIEKIGYNADATRTVTYYAITGKAYTSYEIDYDKTGHYTAYRYYGYSGQTYASSEDDYSWSSTTSHYTLLVTKYFDSSHNLLEKVAYGANGGQAVSVYAVTGQDYGLTYTSYELDYNASGALERRRVLHRRRQAARSRHLQSGRKHG